MDNSYPIVGRGEAVGDLTGRISAPVIDDDYLESIRKTWKLFEESAHHTLDVGGFVVAGKKDA